MGLCWVDTPGVKAPELGRDIIHGMLILCVVNLMPTALNINFCIILESIILLSIIKIQKDYRVVDDELQLARTGSHAALFSK